MDAYKLFQNNIGFGRPIFMCSGILSSCKDKLTILVIEGISSSKHKLVWSAMMESDQVCNWHWAIA
jgi:hypothetical protein